MGWIPFLLFHPAFPVSPSPPMFRPFPSPVFFPPPPPFRFSREICGSTVKCEKWLPVAKVGGDRIRSVPMISEVEGDASHGSRGSRGRTSGLVFDLDAEISVSVCLAADIFFFLVGSTDYSDSRERVSSRSRGSDLV